MMPFFKLPIFLFMVCLLQVNGQNQFKTKGKEQKFNPDISVETFNLDYNLSLTIGQFELLYGETSLIEVPILFKYPISEKLSILAGGKLDFYRVRGSLINEVGISGNLGIQYDFSKDAFIQGLFNYRLNETKASQNLFYNSGSKSSFKLRTGFKF